MEGLRIRRIPRCCRLVSFFHFDLQNKQLHKKSLSLIRRRRGRRGRRRRRLSMSSLHFLCFHFLFHYSIPLHSTAPQTQIIFFIPTGIVTNRPHFLHFLEAIYTRRKIQVYTAGIPHATPIPGAGLGG